MAKLAKLVVYLALLFAAGPALAQTQLAPGQIIGNPTASKALSAPTDVASVLARWSVPLPASVGGTGITSLGTGVATALGVNVGTAGSPVVNGGALGTPSSGVGTNLTGTAAGLTAGHVTTNANLTGDVTSSGNATTLTNAPVIAKVLTGFTSGAGTVTAADSILSAIQKVYGNDALKLPLAGGTMSGNIAMGGNNLTGVGAITATTYNGLPAATPTAAGVVKYDNTTITLNGSQQLVASGAASASVAPGTTTVSGGTAGDILGVTSTGCSSGSPCLSQVTPSAANITYTPPGTGGVATTVQTELQRIGLWANDYGALCNGSNDYAAFQNAINEAQTLGVPLKFLGSCTIATALSVTAGIDFSGATIQSALLPAATIDAIDVDSIFPAMIHDMTIAYGGSPSSSTAAIKITSSVSQNGASHIYNLQIGNCFAGVHFIAAANFFFHDNTIACTGVANSIPLWVENRFATDSGDSVASGNLLQCGPGGFGMLWNSSGGLKFNANKILCAGGLIGINFNLNSTASTSDIFVTGNSMEGWTQVGIEFSRTNATAGLGNIVIANNEIGGGPTTATATWGILAGTDANGVWITQMTVTGNNIEPVSTGSATGMFVDSIAGFAAVGNIISAVGSGTNVAANIGTHGVSATNCVYGPNPKVGTYAANGLGSCTAIAPN